MNELLPEYLQEALTEFKRNIGFYYSYFMDEALVPPDIVQITLSYKCNLRCKMCNIRNIKVDQEMTPERIIALIDEASEWGVPEVLLLGGEPFLQKDLMRFIRYAGAKGLKTTIVTNGTLIDDSMAKIIVDSPLTQLVVSLDGAREKTHDQLRGLSGTYKRVIRAITMIDRHKSNNGKGRLDQPLIIIPITLMNDNLNEMWRYVVLANKLPVSAVGFQPVVIDNANLKFNDKSDSMWIPENRLVLLDKMVDKVITYKRKRNERQPVVGNTFLHLEAIKKYFRGNQSQQNMKCYIGYTRVVISPDGNTSLCGESIGNVDLQTMKNMWNSEVAKQERNKIRKCAKPCLQFCSVRPESELKETWDIFMKRSNYYNSNPEIKKLVRGQIFDIFFDKKNMLEKNIANKDNLQNLEREIDSLISSFSEPNEL